MADSVLSPLDQARELLFLVDGIDSTETAIEMLKRYRFRLTRRLRLMNDPGYIQKSFHLPVVKSLQRQKAECDRLVKELSKEDRQ